jgi:hypothetical protein
MLRVHLGPFVQDEASDELLFSAECGQPRDLVGGKRIEGRKRLFIGALKIYDGFSFDEMAGRLISGVRDIATRASNEFVRFRAGGVVFADQVTLLPSAPSASLPALVASLVRSGCGYLGDEITNVDPVLRRVHGGSLPLLLDPRDVEELGGIARTPSRRRRREPSGDGPKGPRLPVRLEELGGTRSAPAAPARVVFPTFQPGGRTELRQVGSAEALFRFTQACLNLHVWGDRALVLMREMLATVRVEEIVVGSVTEAADLLLESSSEGRG